MWTAKPLIDAVPTLVATLIGGAISIFVAAMIFKRESIQRYEERLTDSLAHVANEIQNFMPSLAISLDAMAQEKMVMANLLDVAAMKADGKDRELIQAMAGAALDVKQDTPEKHQILIWNLVVSLYGWRTKVEKIEFYLNKFKGESRQ
jgi:hypothetical protein